VPELQRDYVRRELEHVPAYQPKSCRVARWSSTLFPSPAAISTMTLGPMTLGRAISHTSVMATGLAVGGDVEQALGSIGVPSYVLDTTGVVRWVNAAAERLVGDVRGRHFTSVVAPEDSRRARELFSRKVLGSSPATDATGVLVSTAGARVAVEISAVPLMSGERVVGVFGLFEGRPDDRPTAPPPQLTPRQVEVLRLLEQGRSTKQIAAELHLSTETVRNHIRRLFRALGVNSRLEAVAAARAGASAD
jgi:PAS domain S-box-containing protein